MSRLKKKILEYSITTVAAAIVIFIVLLIKGIFKEGLEAKEIYLYLTDAFFAIGIIVAGFGLLVFAANSGAFDMLVYGIYRFFTLFKKKPHEVKYETFYDYHIAKAEKPKTDFLFMLIVGLVYIGISMIFLYNWYQS